MTVKTAFLTCLFTLKKKKKKKRGKHITHLGVPETFTEKMSIIDGTQYERAEHRPDFRGFCHLCKGPCWQHLLYIKFPRMQEKSVSQFFYKVLTSWNVARKEWSVEFVKSIF